MQWCRIQNIPPCDVRQFISVPLAIADFDGLPIQKQKVDGRNYLKKHFKSAFLESIKSPCPKTLILDGLVLINKYHPQAVHRTFGEYAGHFFFFIIYTKYITLFTLDTHKLHKTHYSHRPNT